MKKKIAVLISLMMVLTFAFAACGGGSEDLSDSKYVGSWIAESVSVGEESGDLEDGGEYTLTLNGDGTGTFVSVAPDGTEEVSNITWSLTNDGFKTKGDTKLKFTDDGDGIQATLFGIGLHFSRAGEGGEGGEESGEAVDGAAYGYAGDDPVELACYKYMVDTYKEYYEDAEYSIPTVMIVHEDFTPEDEVLVYGDFWINNYNAEGDVLKCASGGSYPGCMHVSKADNTVTAFDEVADGGDFDSSAREIFGDAYEDFMKVYGDSEAREENRKITISDYVNLNGLEFNYYQDEGWDPVELYHAPGQE